MKLLSIGLPGTDGQGALARKNRDGIVQIKKSMEKSLAVLSGDGFIVKIEEVSKGEYLFLECHIEEGELSFKNYERIKEILRRCVADALTGFILTTREELLINKIIQKNYTYFSREEHEILTDITQKNLGAAADGTNFPLKERKKLIRESVMEYLDIYHELVLDGFINFRLKEYRQRLEDIVDTAADDFMMEEEYKEFIRVLRHFVDIQPPRTEEVHVVIGLNKTFKILDKSGNLINTQYLGNIVTQNCLTQDIEIMPDELNCQRTKPIVFKQTEFRPNDVINYEDALISVLITIAPNSIMVHTSNYLKNQETIETLKSVFGDRMLVCKGCEICRAEQREGMTGGDVGGNPFL